MSDASSSGEDMVEEAEKDTCEHFVSCVSTQFSEINEESPAAIGELAEAEIQKLGRHARAHSRAHRCSISADTKYSAATC